MLYYLLTVGGLSSGVIAAIAAPPVIIVVIVSLVLWGFKGRRASTESRPSHVETTEDIRSDHDTVMSQSSANIYISAAFKFMAGGGNPRSEIRMQESSVYGVGKMQQPAHHVPQYEVVM